MGHEQQGYRPVLVISPSAFNRVTKLPIVLPITTVGDFARRLGFAVSLTGSGSKITGIVRCDQPRTVDLHARDARKVDTLGAPFLREVLEKVSVLFRDET